MTNFQYSKKGKRQLTPFFSRELLFDYKENRLDPERHQCVLDLATSSLEVRQELQKLEHGILYAELLSQTVITPVFVDRIRKSESHWDQLLQKINFGLWPQGLKWGLEAAIVAVGIISVGILMPWNQLTRVRWMTPTEMVLSEVKKAPTVYEHEEPVHQVKIEDQTTFPDEGIVAQKQHHKDFSQFTQFQFDYPVYFSSKIRSSIGPSVEKTVEAKTKVAETTPVSRPVEAKNPTVASSSKVAENTSESTSGASNVAAKAGQGFLFRGVIRITNIEATTPKLVEKISEMGGRKAGEVPLGWKKGNSSYFHFTLPENKYEEFKQFMTTYGALKIQKEHHERVMPDGIIRLIISVEENSQPKGASDRPQESSNGGDSN